jgi:hypothetical protein
MKERDRAQMWAASSENREDWATYRALRNNVTKRLKTEKKNCQKRKLEDCNNDSGKLWANVKGWLNWATSSAPAKLFHDGRIETSPINIATIMNNLYINKVQDIRANLPEANTDPLQELRKQMQYSTLRFTLDQFIQT